MDDRIEGTYPTRMELLRIKNKTKIADKGHRLLKEKRDAISLEFFESVRKAGNISSDTAKKVRVARTQIVMAKGAIGSQAVTAASISSERPLEVTASERKMMGVTLPSFHVMELKRKPDQRGYNITFTSPVVDQTAIKFEDALQSIVALAQAESNIRVLSRELRKTRRRVNALEYRVLPRLKNTKRYIEMHLEEQARDSFSRLKRVKRKKQ
ncbi:MAG: V-type ATP synthase subunit D [Candidatus Altiarchaeota archaeon]